MTEFALLGRHPLCGCPMAVDMTASGEAQSEFSAKGYLLEFLSPAAAKEAWDGATWPCPHSGHQPEAVQSSSGEKDAEAGILQFPALRLVENQD